MRNTLRSDWLTVARYTLPPVLRRGDRVRLTACASEALRRGDLVVTHGRAGASVRIVRDTHPLVVASLRASDDDDAVELTGSSMRIAQIDRGGHTMHMGQLRRVTSWLAWHALQWWRSPLVTRSRSTLGSLPWLRRVRAARIGALEVRRVTVADATALGRFAATVYASPGAADFLGERLATRWAAHDEAGVAIGAFDRRGTMHGFVFIDAYVAEGVPLIGLWVRMLAVSPAARRVGIGAALVRAACAAVPADEPVIHSEVWSDNAPSLRLFRRLGFVDAPNALQAQTNALLGVLPNATRRRVALVLRRAD